MFRAHRRMGRALCLTLVPLTLFGALHFLAAPGGPPSFPRAVHERSDLSSVTSYSPAPSVIATIGVGADPMALTYDPVNGNVYVINFNFTGVGTVSVISGATLEATLVVGRHPTALTVDTQSGYLYVADAVSNDVRVFSGTTNQELAEVAVGNAPTALMYDQVNGYVYVADSGSDNVSVISGTKVIASAPVPGSPGQFAIDTKDGSAYVGVLRCGPQECGLGNVGEMVGTTLVDDVRVGVDPGSLAYDSSSGDIYAANYGSDNVSIISGASVVATIPVGAQPEAMTVATDTGIVYVANLGSSNVSVLSGTAEIATIPLQGTLGGIAYDGSSGTVYVSTGANVTVLSGTGVLSTVDVGGSPGALTADPRNGYVYATNAAFNSVDAISVPSASRSPWPPPWMLGAIAAGTVVPAIAWLVLWRRQHSERTKTPRESKENPTVQDTLGGG